MNFLCFITEAEISTKSYAEVVRNTTEKDVDFYRIYENLVKDEKSNSSLIETSPPVMCTNCAHVTDHSCSFAEEKDTLFSAQDKRSFLFWKSCKKLLMFLLSIKLGCLVIFVQTLSSI